MERDADIINRRAELDHVERELDKAIQAIPDGVPGAKLKDKIGGLEARRAELLEMVADSKEPVALLHLNMAAIYRQRISALCKAWGVRKESTGRRNSAHAGRSGSARA